MKMINLNILSVETGIICHQVNTLGLMGRGLAKEIKERYPEVYTKYRAICKYFLNSEMLYGNITFIPVTDKLYVSNLFSQVGLIKADRITPTDYGLLKECLIKTVKKRNDICERSNIIHQIYLPFKIGCGLAGGSWEEVLKIISEVELEFSVEFIVCVKG